MILWLVECAGVLLDLCFLWGSGYIPENMSDGGIWVSFLYGLLLGTAMLFAGMKAPNAGNGWTVIANVIYLVPQVSKVLRLTGIVESTEGVSLIVMSALDIDSFWISALCSMMAAAGETGSEQLLLSS